MWLALAGVAGLWVLSVLAIVYWGLPALDAYYKSRPVDDVARILVLLAVLWVLLPVLPMGAYLFRYGVAVTRAGRHPLPEWRFMGPQLRPGKIVTGRRASIYGVVASVCGVMMVVAFVATIGIFLYILFAK